jgi:AraC-like DNA-binding protein
MLVFSTSGRSVDEAFAGWRTAICGHFVPLRPEPSASCANFFGEVSSWPLAGLTLSNILATGQRIHRERPEISHSDRDVLFLTLQLTGDTGLVCDDQRKLVRPGDMYYLDARRPFALHCEGRVFSLTIPRQACDGRLAALAHLHGSVAKPDDTVGSLLRDYLCSLASAERNLGAVAEEDIADHLVTLISHAFARRETDASPPHGAVRAALFARAYRLIDRKLCDPDFDPARLARDAGVSLRQLQSVFAENDTSPMRAIFGRRITLAKRMLQDPRHAHKTITQIVFECGFRDLSHFGRVFAAATGSTPRAWRRSGEHVRIDN